MKVNEIFNKKRIIAFVMAFAMVVTSLSGISFASNAEGLDDTVPVHQLYNANTSDHFFTISDDEATAAVMSYGYTYEKDAYRMPLISDDPVYCMVCPNSAEHIYSKDIAELTAWCLAHPEYYLQGDGEIVWYSADEETGVPVYQFFNPNQTADKASHMFVLGGSDDYNKLVQWGWKNDGVKFYAEGEASDRLTGVQLSTTAPQVGETITANPVPATAKNVAGFQWTLNGEPFLGAESATFTVPASCKKGDSIVCIATDTDGKEFKSNVATVTVAAATLIDEDGLQADGTALVGDTLRTTYTAELGDPNKVTWFRDGAAVQTATEGDIFAYTPTQPGNYFAVLSTQAGKSATSNTLTVTKTQVKALISDYTISEDYTGGVSAVAGASNIVYDSETNKQVATFTVNKAQYTGVVGLVESEKVLAGTAKASDVTRTAILSPLTFVGVTSKTDFTDEKAIAAADTTRNVTGVGNVPQYGICYENGDGTISYKWLVNSKAESITTRTTTQKLKRGQSYVLGFAQDDVSDATDIDTYVIGGMYSAPYVQAPEDFEITKCSAGEKIEFTAVDADGKKLEWLGGTNATTPTEVGLKSAYVYGNYSNSVTGAQRISTQPEKVNKGVYTADGAASDTYSYYYGVFTFESGIYGEDELVIATDTQKIATKSLDGINVYEDLTRAGTAVVKLRNLATDGTVYLVNADNIQNAQKALKEQTTTGDNKIVGYSPVERGDSEVDVTGLKSAGDKNTKNHNYFAFFIPEDTSAYSMGATTAVGNNKSATPIPETSDATNNALTVEQLPLVYDQVLTIKNETIASGATVANSGGAIIVTTGGNEQLFDLYDQFGVEIEKNATTGAYDGLKGATIATYDFTKATSEESVLTAVKMALKVNADGFTEITFTTTGGEESKGSTWTAKNKAGQTIKAVVDKNNKWTVTCGF